MAPAFARRGFILQGLAAASGSLLPRAWELDPAIIGANTAIAGYGLYEAIELLRELGFATVEIHPMGMPAPVPGQFPGFQFDRLSEQEKRRVKSALRGFRHITTHLPFVDLHYFSRFEPIAEFSVRQIDIALEATAYFGGELAVVHPMPASGLSLEEAWPTMLHRFRQWGEVARKRGFRLALETGYPKSVRDFVRLVKEINRDSVGCAIDVGHQAEYEELAARVKPQERSTPAGVRAYNDTSLAIIEQLGSKIFHLHVHDIDRQTWREHRPTPEPMSPMWINTFDFRSSSKVL